MECPEARHLLESFKVAVQKNDLPQIKTLLQTKKFELSAGEMDELLLHLPETSLLHVGEFLSPRALLCMAAKKGDEANVKWDLRLKASAFASAAAMAVLNKHAALAEKLFERSCKTEDKLWDAGIVIPLLYDVLLSSTPASRIIMMKGHSAVERNVAAAVIHFATKTNNVEVLCEILDTWGIQYADAVYLGDSTCSTALHRASHHGHANVVSLLLQKGARVEQPDHHGRTALHFASLKGHLNVVKILLKCMSKEQIDIQDHGGMTALHLATCGGHPEVVKELLENNASLEVTAKTEGATTYYSLFLETFLSFSRVEIEKLQRNDCFRLNPIMSMFWNPGGFTTLHYAVVYGGKAVLDELLKRVEMKVVRMKDMQGLTAFDWAEAMDESLEVVFESNNKVVHHGCNFSKDKAKGLMEELKRMQELKRQVDWIDKMGWALRNGHWEVAQLLATGKEYTVMTPGGNEEDLHIGHMAWKHLEWASEGDEAIQEDWASDRRTCIKGHTYVWKRKVEKVMMALVITRQARNRVCMEKAVLQDCLMWAMKQQMVALAMEMASQKECDIMEVTHGRAQGETPLEHAAHWHKGPWGPIWGLRPVLQVMEQREDVRSRIYEDRQLYVDFLNAVLVASVLIAGLAFSSSLQPPSNVKSLGHLVRIFVWANHISFFSSIVATFAGICGAIPSPSCQLAYSKRKIQKAGTVATLFIVGAVVAITVSFTALTLDLLDVHSSMHRKIKIFSIVCGCSSSIVLFWLMTRLVQVWDPAHHVLSFWAKEQPDVGTGWRYYLAISIVFCIKLYLTYVHGLIPMPANHRRDIHRLLIKTADHICGGNTQTIIDKQRSFPSHCH